jgi:hypothetical protein
VFFESIDLVVEQVEGSVSSNWNGDVLHRPDVLSKENARPDTNIAISLTTLQKSSQKVLRWRLFLEECQPQLHCIKGADDAVADASSQLLCSAGQGTSGPSHRTKLPGDSMNQTPSSKDEDAFTASAFSILDADNTPQPFLSHPTVSEEHPFALEWDTVATAQNQDATVLLGLARQPRSFGRFETSEAAERRHSFLSSCA